MSDSNTLFLQTASSVINELDLRYTEADRDGKIQLKEELDKAMMTFSEIRCKILENEVTCTPDDVAHMQALRQQVQQTADMQVVLLTVVHVTSLLARLWEGE